MCRLTVPRLLKRPSGVHGEVRLRPPNSYPQGWEIMLHGDRFGVIATLRRGSDIVVYDSRERRNLIKAQGYRPAWSELAMLICSLTEDATKGAVAA